MLTSINKLNLRVNKNKRNILSIKDKKLRIGSLVVVYYYTFAQNILSRRIFAGICIAKKKKNNNISITIKNILKKVEVEMRFLINSPIVIGVKVETQKKKILDIY